MKTNSRFEIMQRIEKLVIENLQILHDAKCRQFHFCQDKFNISHAAEYRSLIADVQNEDNSIFYMIQNMHFFIFHHLNENKYHILHGA